MAKKLAEAASAVAAAERDVLLATKLHVPERLRAFSAEPIALDHQLAAVCRRIAGCS